MGRSTKTILVVDDDPEMHLFLKRLLRDNGFGTIHAVSGSEGLHLTQENDPDVVILDVTMPLAEGAGLFNALKANPQLASIPVVFLSSIGWKTLMYYQKLSPGAHGQEFPVPEAFLDKPPEAEALLGVINRLTSACSQEV